MEKKLFHFKISQKARADPPFFRGNGGFFGVISLKKNIIVNDILILKCLNVLNVKNFSETVIV